MNVNWIVLDYVAICDTRTELLDFEDFILLWIEANEIAERTGVRALLVSDMSE